MLNEFYKKALNDDNARKVAVAEGLIDVNSLDPQDYRIVLHSVEENKNFCIPEKFLGVIPTDTLFDYAERSEVAREIIARSNLPDFKLPDQNYYGKRCAMRLNLQKALLRHFAQLELKELKKWEDSIDKTIWQEILKLRRKAGAEKARITRKGNPNHPPKTDALLVAIRSNDAQRLNYFRLNELKRERFFSVLPEWIKADDEMRSRIFETPYVKELSEGQYIRVLKSWLRNRHWCSGDIGCLKLEILRKLDADEFYRAMEKFLNKRIERIEPMPTLDEVKQKLLPKLLSNSEETEKVYLQYKEKSLFGEIDKFKDSNGSIKEFFSEKEIKKIKVIISTFDSYHSGNDELRLKTDFYEWVLSLLEGKKEALCGYLCESKS